MHAGSPTEFPGRALPLSFFLSFALQLKDTQPTYKKNCLSKPHACKVSAHTETVLFLHVLKLMTSCNKFPPVGKLRPLAHPLQFPIFTGKILHRQKCRSLNNCRILVRSPSRWFAQSDRNNEDKSGEWRLNCLLITWPVLSIEKVLCLSQQFLPVCRTKQGSQIP